MTIVADPSLTCLSNMDVNKEFTVPSNLGGATKKAVLYNLTPRMSTYLVALAVGEFECLETNAFRVSIRAFVPPSERVENARHALDLTAQTLEFYEIKFNCPFPLPKMDMAVVPDRPGAMENWGLILYAPNRLLVDPASDSATAWSSMSETIQHELAHQWFGNVVTMNFWDGLWLNEDSLRGWLSALEIIYIPIGKPGRTLTMDSVRSSHPVEVPVRSSGQINEIFDGISYSKGQAIIRMIVNYLGEDIFMKGIQQYFANHAYGNTRTEDLWNVLEQVSRKPVGQIMSIWTLKIILEQQRFLKTGDVKAEEDTTIYPLSLGLRTKAGVVETPLMTERTLDLFVPDSDFFKLNSDHVGFYRVAYSPARLASLGASATKVLLSVEDRAGLLSDAIALSIAGNAKTSGLLAFVKNLDDEESLVVWDAIWFCLESLNFAWKFEDKLTRIALKKLACNLVAPLTRGKGWTFSSQDSSLEKELKALLFGIAASSNEQTVLDACQELFEKYKSGNESAIAPDNRQTVFSTAMKRGDKTTLDFLINAYKTNANADVRRHAIGALGAVQDPTLVDHVLYFILNSDVRAMDMFPVLDKLRGTPDGIRQTWTWFKTHYDEIVNKAPTVLGMLGAVVRLSFSGFTTLEQLAEVEDFFSCKDTSAYKMNLDQGMDQIRANAGWANRDREDVRQYLEHSAFLAGDEDGHRATSAQL